MQLSPFCVSKIKFLIYEFFTAKKKFLFLFKVLFMILMPILLMNLLIGLAVGDIESVKRNAQLKRLAMQVRIWTLLKKILQGVEHL